MAKKETNNQDVLEAYPEKEQVDAFPERRYVRLVRFLTIFSVINLACVFACSGLYFYMARNKDITLNNMGWVHMYSIDPEKKQLLPSEPFQKGVSALQLVTEKTLRRYLEERYSYISDLDTMTKRWGENGYVAHLSNQEVYNRQRNGKARDLHIYSLYPLHGDLWSAYIETFDFLLDENLEKACDCMDNSSECLSCKEENMVPGSRRRMKILLRINFSGPRICKNEDCDNPLGMVVYAYYPAYVPVPKNKEKAEKFWDLPPALRPDV